MECSNQAEGYVHTLKSGETVFFYNDHSTGEQDLLASNNATTTTKNNTHGGSTQTCIDYCHSQDVTGPSMHSTSTQTDHTTVHTSVGMGTIYDCPRFNTTTRYRSAATETDLKAVGDRGTLEGILKWALAICRSLPIPGYEESPQSASDETHSIPSLHESQLESELISSDQIGQLTDTNYVVSSIQAHRVDEIDVCEQYSDDENHLPSLHERQLENNLFCNTQMDNISYTNAVGPSIQAVPVPRNDVCQQYSHDRSGAISMQENENCGYSNCSSIRGKVDKTLEAPDISVSLNEISAFVKERINKQEPETEMEEEGDETIDLPTQVNPISALKERCCIEVESAGHNKRCNLFEQSHIEPITDNTASFGNTFIARECTERSMVVHVPSHDLQADFPAASGVRHEGQGKDETEAVCEIGKCPASDGPQAQFERSMVPMHHVQTDLSSASNLTSVPEGVEDTGTPFSEVIGGRYMCKTCGKRFNTKESKAFHSRIHNNERPFACEQCGKRFKTKTHLKIHRHVHLRADERPYRCTICNKRFTQTGVLKNHMFIHSNEKPFGCTMCERRFNHPSNLKVHMNVHTKERPYQCSN